jgi:predicted CXXCH cytochrome family protein
VKSTPATKIDDETQLCLSCHDGLMASDTVAAYAFATPGEMSPDHPIGVSMAPRMDSIVRTPSQLDGRIRLFNDRVGCQSCHSPYSNLPKLLVMSNLRSQLCLSCHL